jgi:hypothetical protein
MKLTVSIPTVLGEKLHQLALRDLRPIAMQAEYMLCRAIRRAQCQVKPAPSLRAEKDTTDAD